MDVQPNLEFSVLSLQGFHRVRDLLPGLQPLTGLLDEMIYSLLGIQPIGGVLQHVVELLRPIGEFGLRVFPVTLKPVNYKDRKKEIVNHCYQKNGNVQDTLCFVVHFSLLLYLTRTVHIINISENLPVLTKMANFHL